MVGRLGFVELRNIHKTLDDARLCEILVDFYTVGQAEEHSGNQHGPQDLSRGRV